MNATLLHRGPDAQGVWHEGAAGLGHCRLAIRDLSPQGQQPFFSHCQRYVMVYNGEIYNDGQIAQELARHTGFTRRTTTDTEVIVQAFAHWGVEAFARLEGIFALAVWDRERRELVLARDAVGVKPLYMDQSGGALFFASEIKAILAATQHRPVLCPEDVDRMLCMGHTSPERTLVQGIGQLAAGSVARFQDGACSLQRYWTPRRQPAAADGDPVSAQDVQQKSLEFIEIFQEVVQSQLVSDVPLGVMQSGGIDSSLVSVSLPGGAAVPLFSVRFPGTRHDESSLVRELAAQLGREVVWVDLPAGSAVEEDFRAVVHGVDGQLADSTCLAVYSLSRAIRRHAKVVLAGEGSDEFFGGYDTYKATWLAQRLRPWVPRALARAGAGLVRRHGGISPERIGRREKLARLLEGMGTATPHVHWRHYLPPSERGMLYGPALQQRLQEDAFAQYAAAYDGAQGDCTDKAMTADQQYYLAADMLVKVDRMSMAHNLEVRVPFLDRRVMEFANALPQPYLFDNFRTTKSVLRQALRQLGVPASITDGRKLGFNLPMDALMTGDLRRLFHYYLHDHADMFAPLLRPEAVRGLWLGHVNRRCDAKYPLWALATLGVWMDQAGAQAAS